MLDFPKQVWVWVTSRGKRLASKKHRLAPDRRLARRKGKGSYDCKWHPPHCSPALFDNSTLVYGVESQPRREDGAVQTHRGVERPGDGGRRSRWRSSGGCKSASLTARQDSTPGYPGGNIRFRVHG